jgi:hypothetical protein
MSQGRPENWHLMWDASLAEIAKDLGCSIQAVRTMAARGVRAIWRSQISAPTRKGAEPEFAGLGRVDRSARSTT